MVRGGHLAGAPHDRGLDLATPAPARALRVAIPLAGLILAGGVKNTLAMASGLAARGHHVTVIVPDLTGRSAFPIDPRVRIRRLRTGPAWWPAALRKLVYYARLSLVAAAASDVCIAVYYLTAYAAATSAALRGRVPVAYIVSAHEPVTHGLLAEASGISRRIRRALAALSYGLPVHKVYVSRWLASVTGDVSGPTITLGIDHDVFRPDGRRRVDGPVRVGVIARSGLVKGFDVFAAACAGDWDPEIEIHMVRLDPVAAPRGPGVRILGPQDPGGMADFYRTCDVFVLPSRSEGFPAPPLEAMACGTAVVATRSGGIEEYASDGANALLVPPGDPHALREAIARVVSDRALRARLAEAGVRTAATYRVERTVDELERLLRGLVEASAHPNERADEPRIADAEAQGSPQPQPRQHLDEP